MTNGCPFYTYGKPCDKTNCKDCVIGFDGVVNSKLFSKVLKFSTIHNTDYCCTNCHLHFVSDKYLDYDIDESVCKTCRYYKENKE